MNSVVQDNRYADTALIARYESAGQRCGRLSISLGSAVLLGWLTGIVTLTNLRPDWAAMRPIAALCMILAGIAMYAAGKSRTDRRWHRVQMVSAAIVFAIALVTLIEHAFGLQFRIDQLFQVGHATPAQAAVPGRMAVVAAANFLLTAAALALLDTRMRWLSQMLALLAVGIATLAILGYAYGVSEFYDGPFFTTVALHTAIGTLLVALGILLVRPAHGVVAIMVSGTVGGALARRLLPLTIATPLLIGWLRIEGERQAFYDSSLGVALTSVAYVILFGLFTWRDAEALRRNDDLRLDAEYLKQVKQAQLNGLIDSAMDAIIMLDSAHRIIIFNRAAEKMFGYAHASVLGSSLNMLLPQRFHPGHDAMMGAFGMTGATSRRMGRLGSVTAMRADGTEFPAETSISHFDVGPNVYYLAIMRDITERNRIERELHESGRRERARSQELSNLLHAVPAAVCIAHDRQLTEVRGNELYDRWFGDDDTGQAALRQAAAGKEMRDYEFRHVHPNGSVRYLFGNAVPLLDEQGCPCGAISAFVDVTELKLTEQAMLSVTAGSVAKSDYITHMTHELRTPLGTMLGYAQLLETGKPAPSPKQLTAIGQIIKAGWHLRDLITEVQELAKIEADSARLPCERVCIDALLHDLRAMIAPLVSDAGLLVNLARTNGMAIHANPRRIKQVMLNLMSNAIKYNRRGGRIDVSCAMDGPAQVRIGVRDTGHGLTPNQLASLFQPFNRLGQERSEVVGTGVGLVVTKKLVESMGGAIGVESEVGRGSLFWFSMPAATRSMEMGTTFHGARRTR
jgi:PAS domain S-box-containing protein